MPTLHIGLLGPFSAGLQGSPPLQFPTKSAQALLAYLAEESRENRTFTREFLAEMLWPGMPSGSGRKNLRQALYELNRLLPANEGDRVLSAGRSTIRFENAAASCVDTRRFESLAASRTAGDLARAIEFYRGDFMEGFSLPDSSAFEDWIRSRQMYYRRRLREVLYALIEADPEAAESAARRLVELDPLDEEAVRTLMRLLVDCGDRTEALKQYGQLREALSEELGVDPDRETAALYEQLLRGDYRRRIHESPPTVPKHAAESQVAAQKKARAVRLPASPTPFIGRAAEIEQITAYLRQTEHRLLSLIGPGGSGKTRLAVEAAGRLTDFFKHVICFVPLATAQTEEALVLSIAKSLDFSVHAEDRPRQQVLDFLRQKECLLVLDNFEGLAGSTGFVTDLLATSPDVKLLVTSRVRLNVRGEQLFPVGGLEVPQQAEIGPGAASVIQSDQYSALALFIERARRVQPDFAVRDEDLPAVIDICRLTEGMPLAIELAAAWTQLLPPAEIAAEIRRSLDFLESDWADVPARQRSIRAVYSSSWHLLTEQEQEAFLRLCVFVGDFSREAAQAVSGASLRTLLGLSNKSWLQMSGESRFQLHELMRQFGMEKIEPGSAAFQQAKETHAAYFAGFLVRQEARLRGPEQRAAFDAIDQEFEGNIKAAWDWYVEHRRWQPLHEQMALSLYVFGWVRARMEDLIYWLQPVRKIFELKVTEQDALAYAILGIMEIACEEMLSMKDFQPIARLKSLWGYVRDKDLAGRMGYWFVLLAGLYRARNMDADIDLIIDDYVSQMNPEADPWVYAHCLMLQANVWSEFKISEHYLLAADEIFAGMGVVFEPGYIAFVRAQIDVADNKPLVEILDLFERCKKNFAAVGERYHSLHINHIIALYYFKRGMHEEGFAELEEERRIASEYGGWRWLSYSLHTESEIALRYSTFEHAIRTNQESLALAGNMENESDFFWRKQAQGEIHRVYGDRENALAAFTEAQRGFEKLSVTLGLAYIQRGFGDMAIDDGRYEEALDRYSAYLRLAEEDNHQWSIAQAKGKVGLAHATLGEPEKCRAFTAAAIKASKDWGELHLGPAFVLSEIVCLQLEANLPEAAKLALFLKNLPATWVEDRIRVDKILGEISEEMTAEALGNAADLAREIELFKLLDDLCIGS